MSGATLAFTDVTPSAESASRNSARLAPRESPTWLAERIASVQQLGNLRENWDSYGGHPVHRNALLAALRVLKALSSIVGVEKPLIGATPDGNVSFEWEWNSGARSLDLEVQFDGKLHYVYLDSKTGVECEQLTTTLDQIAQWLTSF